MRQVAEESQSPKWARIGLTRAHTQEDAAAAGWYRGNQVWNLEVQSVGRGRVFRTRSPNPPAPYVNVTEGNRKDGGVFSPRKEWPDGGG